jgi:diacylglycerol kinase family enzyme
MSKLYVLYNPIAGDRGGLTAAENAASFIKEKEKVYLDVTMLTDYKAFAEGLCSNDAILVCGGDGTLNRFVNNIYDLKLTQAIYYYATGSGNDFLRDLGVSVEDCPVRIDRYLKDLPTVIVEGKTYRFLNGVGYGIDGYACEVGDQMRKMGKKPDYTSIAIKGLLFYYKPTSATVTVDGVTTTYKKVWIAPTMYGRYYGGGMMPVPDQDRNHPDRGVAVMLMHNSGKFRTLCVFPSLFKGAHIKYKKRVQIIRGQEITVEFDRPVTLQIDGETIFNVKKYQANCPVLVK